jgi:hypothetical protein
MLGLSGTMSGAAGILKLVACFADRSASALNGRGSDDPLQAASTRNAISPKALTLFNPTLLTPSELRFEEKHAARFLLTND